MRTVEVLYAFDEAIRLLDEYVAPDAPCVDVPVHAGVGYGATEAPRGLLYQRYKLSEDGSILDARIVPPTSQNQMTIEQDLRSFVEDNLNLAEKQLTWQCEQMIRNYDPCISCATHFLKLDIEHVT